MDSPSPVYVKPLDDYKILLRFNNDEERIFDVKPYLDDKYFATLKDTAKPLNGSVILIFVQMNFILTAF